MTVLRAPLRSPLRSPLYIPSVGKYGNAALALLRGKQGFAVSFIDDAVAVQDNATPSNNFVGTASVDVERLLPNGNYIKIETAVTADYNKIAEYPANVTLRLNCTAHTNNVVYVMQTGPEG